MKIAVIGNCAREHAIVWKLCQHSDPENIYFLPGNAGFSRSFPVDVDDFNELEQFCLKENIELIIPGPEAPLVNGLKDHFDGKSIRVFGPSKKAAQLEGSKVFAKQFMKKHGVATASYEAYASVGAAMPMINSFNGNLVIKYDGLAGGKGVYVCRSMEEAEAALTEMKEKYGSRFSFLVEQIMEGPELSVIGITDGKCIKLLSASQDHKRVFDGDEGPNTGGMGAYTPVPFYDNAVEKAINKEIIEPTLRGVKDEGLDYIGFIYFGIILTERGPKLLEYNVRLGDPEAEVVLPKLKNDLAQLVVAALDGKLSKQKIENLPGCFVDVVLASEGYPGKFEVGHLIQGMKKLNEDTLLFQHGTRAVDEGLITDGGRVLNVVSHGKDLEDALEKVYRECAKIKFKGMHYRKDIGQKALLQPA